MHAIDGGHTNNLDENIKSMIFFLFFFQKMCFDLR